MRLPIAITALALLLPLPARAQDPRPAVGTDTVLTFADSSFVAGGFHRFLFGREYLVRLALAVHELFQLLEVGLVQLVGQTGLPARG